jgi:hypothetical protein
LREVDELHRPDLERAGVARLAGSTGAQRQTAVDRQRLFQERTDRVDLGAVGEVRERDRERQVVDGDAAGKERDRG